MAGAIPRDLRRRMVRAAALIRQATNELHAAQRQIQRHPDFKASLQAEAARRPAREHVTPAYWLNSSLESVLEDAPLHDAAGWISDDLRDFRGSMEDFIRDEEETLARRAAA